MPLVIGLAALLGAVLLLASGITDASFADVATGKAGQLYRQSTPTVTSTAASTAASASSTASSGASPATGSVSGGVTGASSWFGGPNDPSAGGAPASGLGWVPGIAVYNQATLGGWWLLRAPNGQIGIVRQMDIGPAPSTGRKFDYSYNLLPLFGYSQGNFPTGANSTGIYLGKSVGDVVAHLAAALSKLGASAQQRAQLLADAHHLTGSVVA
jgi:hypothetical protein